METTNMEMQNARLFHLVNRVFTNAFCKLPPNSISTMSTISLHIVYLFYALELFHFKLQNLVFMKHSSVLSYLLQHLFKTCVIQFLSSIVAFSFYQKIFFKKWFIIHHPLFKRICIKKNMKAKFLMSKTFAVF